MANFKDSPHFQVYDDYYTPKYAWSSINHLLPKDKVIWESCCLGATKSKSPEYLQELGNKVVFDTGMDMLSSEPETYDYIVTNIPFDKTIKIPILERLIQLDKPFIIIMNSMNTFAKYFHKIFKSHKEHLQILTPDGKIHFQKLTSEGEIIETKNCSFYCVYVAYKMNIPQSDTMIEMRFNE